MAPIVTVLQLDTQFPRIPGDVACPDTYNGDIEIIRIPSATVEHVVSNRPDTINISAFESALKQARGNVIVTSCGFLAYWQKRLAALTQKTFISSSLNEFKHLSQLYAPNEILTLTFDKASLTKEHFGEFSQYAKETVELPADSHLRNVITEDKKQLNVERVAHELKQLIKEHQQPYHRHLLLECTNLPPYKAELRQQSNLNITDILTCVEDVQPGSIQSEFLA